MPRLKKYHHRHVAAAIPAAVTIDPRDAEVQTAIDAIEWMSAPPFSGDYSDTMACMTEAGYLAAWCYQKELSKHLSRWNDWLMANSRSVAFTQGEIEAWASLCDRANKADCRKNVSALRPIAAEMIEFWGKYYRSSRTK